MRTSPANRGSPVGVNYSTDWKKRGRRHLINPSLTITASRSRWRQQGDSRHVTSTDIANGRDGGWQGRTRRRIVTPKAIPALSKAGISPIHVIDPGIEARQRTAQSDSAYQYEAHTTALTQAEQQLARKTAALSFQHEHIKTLNGQLTSAKTKLTEVENELTPAREALIHQENQSRSLQASLELSLGENQRLSGHLTEMEAMVDDARSQIERYRQVLAATEQECNKFATAANAAADKKRRAETAVLQNNLEVAMSRVHAAETALKSAERLLSVNSEERLTAEHRLAETTRAHDASERKLEMILNVLQLKERQIGELDKARLKSTADAGKLLEGLKAKTDALARAEDRFAFLVGRAKDIHAKFAKSQKTIKELNVQLNSDRNERKLLEGLLRKALKSYAELENKLRDHDRSFEADLERNEVHSAQSMLAETIIF